MSKLVRRGSVYGYDLLMSGSSMLVLPGAARPSESFIGRTREIAAIVAALSSAQLVTITGAGGMGKTRLARRLCEERAAAYAGGARLCDLSSAKGIEDVCLAVARAMGIAVEPGSSADALVERLGDDLCARGPLLLVLDNIEGGVGPASAAVRAWLARAPETAIVITSRERLGLAEEHVIELPPLGLSPESDEAVTLFVDRARAAGGEILANDRAAIERLVRELDGIPLAIELCAARASILSPAEICEMLPKRLSVLADPRERHRTMRRAIAWSVDMLSPRERSAFAQCAVFRGGFFRDAAEAVLSPDDPLGAQAVLDVLATLRERSLVRSSRIGDRTRFSLFAVIREYAEEIAAESLAATEARHAAHYLALLERSSPLVMGPRSAEALRALAIEEENILEMIERHLAKADAGGPRAIDERSAALRALAALEPLILTQGVTERHIDLLTRAVGKGASDPARAELSPSLFSHVLNTRAIVRRIRGEPHKALDDFWGTIAIATEAGDRVREGMARGSLGFLLSQLGRFDEALAQYELAKTALEAGGASAEVRGDLAVQMGTLHVDRGEPVLARQALFAARDLYGTEAPARSVAIVMGCLGTTYWQEANHAEARVHYRRAQTMVEELGDTRNQALGWMSLGRALADEGHAEEALSLLDRATLLFRTIDYRLGEMSALGHRAFALHELGRNEEALSAYVASTGGLFKLGARAREGMFLAGMGALLARMDRPREAEDAFAEAEDRLRDVPNEHLRAALSLHRLHLSPPETRAAKLHEALAAIGDRRSRSPEIRFAERLFSKGSAPPERPKTKAPTPDILLDVTAGAVVVAGARTVDLRKKPLLSRMLAVLIERGGRPIDKASLFAEVWRAEYAPSTRSASLYKAVDRLAHLLSPDDPKRFLRWDEQGRLFLTAQRAERQG